MMHPRGIRQKNLNRLSGTSLDIAQKLADYPHTGPKEMRLIGTTGAPVRELVAAPYEVRFPTGTGICDSVRAF